MSGVRALCGIQVASVDASWIRRDQELGDGLEAHERALVQCRVAVEVSRRRWRALGQALLHPLQVAALGGLQQTAGRPVRELRSGKQATACFAGGEGAFGAHGRRKPFRGNLRRVHALQSPLRAEDALERWNAVLCQRPVKNAVLAEKLTTFCLQWLLAWRLPNWLTFAHIKQLSASSLSPLTHCATNEQQVPCMRGPSHMRRSCCWAASGLMRRPTLLSAEGERQHRLFPRAASGVRWKSPAPRKSQGAPFHPARGRRRASPRQAAGG